MPSVFEFMENHEIFPYETTLTQNPDILHALIDYISTNPNPILQNQQQCYIYPSRSAEILSMGTTYRPLIAKRDRKNKKTNEDEVYYPHLERLFKNIRSEKNIEQSLLGYLNKVLVSLAKKTPEIYEFFKDSQELMTELIKDNQILLSLTEFWITFLIESTMSLYIFLKNILIRALMFRIIDETDTQNIVVYETLYTIYSEITKKVSSKFLPEDEKEELQEICHNFEDEDFVTLLVLKISSLKPQKTIWIGKTLLLLLSSSKSKEDMGKIVSQSHIEAFEDYFEGYQESSGFMDYLLQDQIEILKVLFCLSQLGVLSLQHNSNLLKRLLVYSSIHKRNSTLHSLLIRMLGYLVQNKKIEVLQQINVIPFLRKNSLAPGAKYSYGALVWRVCQIWHDNSQDLYALLQEEEKQFVKGVVGLKLEKFSDLTLYKTVPLQLQEPIESSSQQISKFQADEVAEEITVEAKQDSQVEQKND